MTTAKQVFICVNGILTNPGDAEGWTDRAVTWLHLHTDARAEKYEYAAGAMTRRLHQDERAAGLAKMAQYYLDAGWSVSFIGHSNGCDIIARVLRFFGWPASFRSAHLFAAAADAEDFRESAMTRGVLQRCFVYGSPNDRALRIAALSRRTLGWLGLGYGSMGLDPVAAAGNCPDMKPIVREDYDHADWFARGEKFEATMRDIVHLEADITIL